MINEETEAYDGASSFLAYLTTNAWAIAYYDVFTWKLPSHGLLENNLDQKFDNDFNITYKDILRDQIELVSYNKWIKTLFDSQIPQILDIEDIISASSTFSRLQSNINCKIQTISTDNASNPNCKK